MRKNKREGDLTKGPGGGGFGGTHGDQLQGMYVSVYAYLIVNPVVAGTLTCSRVAKVSVCPQALLALREQTRTFGQETRHALLKQACWHSAEGRLEASEEHHVFPRVCLVETSALISLY